jgi:putative membrane protein
MAYAGIVNRLIAFGLAVPAGFALAAFARRDCAFIRSASAACAADIAAGQLANENGQNPAIRELGARMLEEHSKACEELRRIADAEGIEAAAYPDDKQQAALDALEALSGAEFDKAYLKLHRKSHARAIRLFKLASGLGAHPELRRFAQATLPMLEAHHAMACDIELSAGGGMPVRTGPAAHAEH